MPQLANIRRGSESTYIYLSGPVNVYYWQSDDYPNKKVILLSDIHESNEQCNSGYTPNYDIDQYLESVFNDTSIDTFDLFIEYDWSAVKKLVLQKHSLGQTNGRDWMSKVVNLSLKKYKKNATKRIHFTDTRPFCGMHRETQNGINMLLENMNQLDEGFNYFDCFETIYWTYLQYIYVFFEDVIKYQKRNDIPFNSRHYVLSKQIRKLEKLIGRPKLLELLEIVMKSIRELFDAIWTNDHFISLQQFKQYGFELIIPITCINELYVFARMMKPDFQNIVLYEGRAHIDFLCKFFKCLNFNVIYENTDGENAPTYKCTKVVPFDWYFKNGINKL